MIHEKNKNSLFEKFLISSVLIIFSMIFVGGLTRLTNSGLSITEWELFKGILPPLNENSWNNYFDLYKKIPQYQLINNTMSLDEFKIIFYWEYFHRILGRFIGLFFLFSLIYFHIKKTVDKRYLQVGNLVFALICIQGLIGWYMVESGLINNISVSHYRLSLHLLIAFIIISIIFWLLISLRNNNLKSFFVLSKKNLPYLILIFLIFAQIIFGAFVSGLDAGKIYQTWPLMGYSYFPNDFTIENILHIFDFNNHSLVQFYHRNLAYILTVYILILSFKIYTKKEFHLYNPLKVILVFLFIQVLLGILTLITGLNIYLASAHQISSVILILSAINLYYHHIK